MAQIQLVKTYPTTFAAAREALSRLKQGAWFNCEIRQARNY